jgi:hypothetical protein
MLQYFLSIKRYLLFAALPLVLLAAGCGSSAGGDSGEITVKTGSLSKAEFIQQADTICKVNRGQFEQSYAAFLKSNPPGPSEAEQIAWLSELVDKYLLPSYEKTIEQISSLGAPSADADQIAAYLNNLQQHLDEVGEKPATLSKNQTPFQQAAKLATAYGLNDCAESLG